MQKKKKKRKITIFLCTLLRLILAGLYKAKRIMKVNIQMFLPGFGILRRCNYRAHTGMMIGLETEVARGKLQYILRYSLGAACFFKALSPAGATQISQPWEELQCLVDCVRSGTKR